MKSRNLEANHWILVSLAWTCSFSNISKQHSYRSKLGTLFWLSQTQICSFPILTWYASLKPPSDCAIYCIVDIPASSLIEGSSIICLFRFPFWSCVVKCQNIDEVQIGHDIFQTVVKLWTAMPHVLHVKHPNNHTLTERLSHWVNAYRKCMGQIMQFMT